MSNKISLKTIIQEMDSQSDMMSAFLNKDSNEITFVSDEEFRIVENQEPIDEFPQWLREQIKIAEEILYGEGWIGLPTNFEIHEYSIMEKFCLCINDQNLSNIMYDSIKGKGAFRIFKYNIRKYNIEDDWYGFRDNALKKIAIEWCEGNNIAYVD